MGVKVLWLTPDKPENISVGRRRIAEHLGERGFDVTLRGTTLQTALQSYRERSTYDIVVGTTRAGALVGAALRLAGGPPFVVDHIDPIRQFSETASWPLAAAVRIGENLAFRLSAATLFVYDEERPRVERYAPRAVQTDLGVSFDRFAEPDDGVVDRATSRLSKFDLRENVAVYVGGLEPFYRIELLLDAVELRDDWSLVVAGTGSLEATVEQVHDGESVVYLGTVPHEDVPGYLRAADVGVSLVDDPHTLKVLEYGAAGLPVVQLDGRSRKRFEDRVTYCAVSSESLAKALDEANDTDQTPLVAFAEQFDYESIADTYAEVFRKSVLGKDF